MKLAIIGGRDFTDYALLKRTIETHFYDCDSRDGSRCPLFDEIVSGGARGGDKLGARLAKEMTNIKLTEFIPDWNRYGLRAGFMRNEDIVKTADFVLAFWDGLSKGTANSLSIAKRLKKPTLIIYY